MYKLHTCFTQISTISGLVALCHSATESPESKLFPKLNEQRVYASNAENQGDLTASASDRSKNGNILFRFIAIFIIYTGCSKCLKICTKGT